jgi:hypothetical protein
MVYGFLFLVIWVDEAFEVQFYSNHGLEQQLSFSFLVNFSIFQPFPLANRSERGECS